jgi:hypothetical protein
MDNIHTCIVCHPDLLVAVVLLMHGKLLKLTGDVVGLFLVKIPIWIGVRGRCHGSHLIIRDAILIIAVPKGSHGVTDLHAHLATWSR